MTLQEFRAQLDAMLEDARRAEDRGAAHRAVALLTEAVDMAGEIEG